MPSAQEVRTIDRRRSASPMRQPQASETGPRASSFTPVPKGKWRDDFRAKSDGNEAGMAPIICSGCGNRISGGAGACPRCGGRKPGPEADFADGEFRGHDRGRKGRIWPNASLARFFASFVVCVICLLISRLQDEEATGLGRQGPPMPEGILAAVIGLGQFYLIGLLLATILASVQLFFSKAHRKKASVSLMLCLLAWSVATWRIISMKYHW